MSGSAPAQAPSATLARFVHEARWEDVPEAVRHEAKRSLLNFFACALGGCRDAAIDAAAPVLRRFSGPAAATVIGRAEKLDVLNAAFLNAASANVFDFDDTHFATVIHPSAPVAAALFAHAESSRVRGADLLLAFILGVEIECRVGNAVSPGHYRKGWHITSTCGVFGAAAGVSRLLQLNAQQALWALGNASAQAGGLLETLGTMGKSVSVGNAARNGIVAAMFAEAGVFGPERPLEGRYGFLNVFGDDANPARLTDGLGETWEIASNAYKLYPIGIVLSPVVEACLALREAGDMRVDDIERVEIVGHPLLRERTDRTHPASGREAQVSGQHAVAVALMLGRAGLAEFGDEAARDARFRPLREKVGFVDDASYPVERADVRVRMRDGTERVHEVPIAQGSAKRPLSDADLEAKLRSLVEYGGSQCDAGALIDALWSIDTTEDAAAVLGLAAGRR